MIGERAGLAELAHLDVPQAEGMLQLSARDGVLYVGTTAPGYGTCVVDVRDPRNPALIGTLPGVPGAISPKVQIGDDLLLVNYERRGQAEPPLRGIGIYDIANPRAPRRIGTLALDSKGVHRMWYTGGRYAYLSGEDDGYRGHIMLIADLADPAHPQIAGRWWIPGSKLDETPQAPPGRLWQLHHPTVHGTRAYVGCWDWGAAIVDVANPAAPALVAHAGPWAPEAGGATHTALCLPERKLMVVTDEALHSDRTPNKFVRIFDIADETRPVELARLPEPVDVAGHAASGRYGPHNLHENQPWAFVSERYIAVSYFNAGLRAYDIADPRAPREIASLEPQAPAGQPRAIVNDLFIDRDGIVFASDRAAGRMYVAELR